ncbi:hypothetical protein NM688_g5606 [Phlebia brevispora]|uniref:Uncharacterized protein n=1 Tax=Phlebia brevispora TaxID=194682 RepID=A0ACC1SSP9_9APHY|nr:hypothetical protein NM688_g5606 [Phlebia brevispora]
MSQRAYPGPSARQDVSSDRSSRSSSQEAQDVNEILTDDEQSSPTLSAKRKRGKGKLPGACVHCKSLKVPHFFPAVRCVAGNHECQARTRKKRKPAPLPMVCRRNRTHEDLQARSKQQDEQLQSLLRQFDQLKLERKIEEWVQRATAAGPIRRDGEIEIGRPVPVVTCHYYSALIGPLNIDVSPYNPHFRSLPIVIRSGILALHEILDLFNLFFERINPFFASLDGEIHCPQKLIWLNEPLFTVICALASRHYIQRPGLYDVLMDIATDLAGDALIRGFKSVETVQAFLLLGVYPVPKKKWVDDRSWLYMGAAVRLAQEIDLHKPPTGSDEQDNVNRLRTWMNCFTVDRSHATQFGKVPALGKDDCLVRNITRTLYKNLASSPYDIALCAYAELFLLMAQFQEALNPGDVSREDMDLDVPSIAMAYDRKFYELSNHWNQELEADPNVVRSSATVSTTSPSSYMRLVVLSQGFQHCVKHGISRDSYILQQSIEVSQTALQTVIEKLYPSSLLGWAMDANFLYMAFSAAFLLNLLRPKFLPLLDPPQCAMIITLVSRLISILSSEDVALDGRHSPAVYSKFLSTLFKKYYTPSLQRDVKSMSPEILPQYDEERAQTPPYIYYWPDIPSVAGTPDAASVLDVSDHDSHPHRYVVRQQVGEAEMDFSLQHFVRSTILPQAAITEPYPSEHGRPVMSAVYYAPQVPEQWENNPHTGTGYNHTPYR